MTGCWFKDTPFSIPPQFHDFIGKILIACRLQIEKNKNRKINCKQNENEI